MKKKLLSWLLSVGLLLLVGCTVTEETAHTETEVLGLSEKSTAAVSEVLTESELLDLFNGYAYADPSERRVVACVVTPDSSYGIYGVVQYTTQEEPGCGFDFVRNGRPYPAGIEASPMETNTLQYLGGDTVSVQLQDVDGQSHVFTISLVVNEAGYDIQITSD